MYIQLTNVSKKIKSNDILKDIIDCIQDIRPASKVLVKTYKHIV